MQWKKLGILLAPGKYEWMITHIQNPFVEKRPDGLYDLHFAGRDRSNRARGGMAVIDMDAQRIVGLKPTPTIDLGRLGCFDDCGVMPSCIINVDGKKFMYYTGWKQEVLTPFSFFIGLFISEDNGKTYERYSLAPVLGRCRTDPFLTCSPWVIYENGLFRMWYVSGTGWEIPECDRKPKHNYHIRYAESNDGFEWKPEGRVCIDFTDGEYAIARPVVSKENGLYKMWYCMRGGWDTYRAGYAESENGLDFTRKDGEAGIDVSQDGWDSQMICYPSVFTHNNSTYMLYNGNNYGQTGVGLAVLESFRMN